MSSIGTRARDQGGIPFFLLKTRKHKEDMSLLEQNEVRTKGNVSTSLWAMRYKNFLKCLCSLFQVIPRGGDS